MVSRLPNFMVCLYQFIIDIRLFLPVKSFNTDWPKYTLDSPKNMVFDGNTTSFIEDDNWRAEALKIFIDHGLDFSH